MPRSLWNSTAGGNPTNDPQRQRLDLYEQAISRGLLIYNQDRPHLSLGYLSPEKFRQQKRRIDGLKCGAYYTVHVVSLLATLRSPR